jgi:hypothetical protein
MRSSLGEISSTSPVGTMRRSLPKPARTAIASVVSALEPYLSWSTTPTPPCGESTRKPAQRQSQ